MLKARSEFATKTLIAALLFLPVALLSLFGCGSTRLVDQSSNQMDTIVESIQANFAEEGWTYTGYEVVETDEEHDTATVSIAYDVDGDAKKLLKNSMTTLLTSSQTTSM